MPGTAGRRQSAFQSQPGLTAWNWLRMANTPAVRGFSLPLHFTVGGRILTLPPGAPVSDPAGIQKRPETRRIGDRRSAVPSRVGGSVKMRPPLGHGDFFSCPQTGHVIFTFLIRLSHLNSCGHPEQSIVTESSFDIALETPIF